MSTWYLTFRSNISGGADAVRNHVSLGLKATFVDKHEASNSFRVVVLLIDLVRFIVPFLSCGSGGVAELDSTGEIGAGTGTGTGGGGGTEMEVGKGPGTGGTDPGADGALAIGTGGGGGGEVIFAFGLEVASSG